MLNGWIRENKMLPRHSELPHTTARHSLGNRDPRFKHLLLERSRPICGLGNAVFPLWASPKDGVLSTTVLLEIVRKQPEGFFFWACKVSPPGPAPPPFTFTSFLTRTLRPKRQLIGSQHRSSSSTLPCSSRVRLPYPHITQVYMRMDVHAYIQKFWPN